MKTNNVLLKEIILMVLFSMILIKVSAQDRNEGNRTKKNPHEQATTPTSAPLSPTQPTQPTQPTPPPPPPPPPYVDQDAVPPQLNLPNLTEDQKTKLDKLHLKQMESMTPLRNQIRGKRARLATILTTTPVDMNAADIVADELGKIHTAILKLMIRHDQALRDLLTPDQRVIFDSRPKPFLRK
jgi:type IV secretory pathway VirB10-like protein